MLLLSQPAVPVPAAWTAPAVPTPGGALTLVRPADVDDHAQRLRRVLRHLRDGTPGAASDLALVLPWYVPSARHFTGTAVALLWADTLRCGHGLPMWVSLLWASRNGGTLRPDVRAAYVVPPQAGPPRPTHVYNLTAFTWTPRTGGLRLPMPRSRRASWATQVAGLRAHAPALFPHVAALADYCALPT